MNSERLMNSSELILKSVDRLGRETEATGFSFISWNLEGSSIQLRVPSSAKVEIADHGIWRLLHDGAKWSRLGILPMSEHLEFRAEYPSKFRIHYQGKTLHLTPRNEKQLYTAGKSARLTGREWRLLGSSLGLHVAFFTIVLGILNIPAVKESIDAKTAAKPEAPKQAAKAGGAMARAEAKPFQGMTFSKFLNLLAAKEFAQDPAAVLLKTVKKDSGAAGAPKVSDVGSSLGGVKGAVDAGNGSLSGTLSKEKFMVTESPAGTGGPSKKISDKQLALLKAKFRDLQSDFQRLYSRILVSDSSLSATVSLELVVKSSGYLSVGSFRARGTYRPDSLEKLKRGMTEIIDGAFVGTEFSGITLRGENVFVR
jgi:hypothetical protein